MILDFFGSVVRSLLVATVEILAEEVRLLDIQTVKDTLTGEFTPVVQGGGRI